MNNYHTASKFLAKSSQGYTLIELIIAMQLAFLVVGLTYSSLLFSQRLLKLWQDKYGSENEIAMISQFCSKILSELHIIQVAEKHVLAGLDQEGNRIRVVLNENFEYNKRNILLQRWEICDGQFSYYLEDPEDHRQLYLKANLTPREIPLLVGLEMKLILVSNQREISIQIFNRFTRTR
ncbi:MAG: hypothetical protein KAJ16_11795 [Calditrichia bacterium]|nr:hypothetical protein [Calditrichia bacterium]